MNEKNTAVTSAGITKSVLALSVAISLLIGMIGGFFFGERRTEASYEKLISAGVYTVGGNNSSSNSTNNNSTNSDDSESNSNDELFASIDYTQIPLGGGYTVESFYGDDESRYYAANLIGNAVPEIQWVNSNGDTHSTKEYLEGQYILEFFSSTCTYCNKTIEPLDAYREKTGNTIISLAFDDGDLSAFNATGEHAWYIENDSDTAVSNFLTFVPWIPTMLYIKDGVIQLVTYGASTEDDFNTNWSIAFDS